jgi:sporulation protein YlmC with PRC-barrel domain
MNTYNQDNLTGRNHEGVHPNLPVKYLTASSVIGDDVFNPAGEKLGGIKDIMLDIHEGSVQYVVLECGGFLGIGEKLFAIPFRMLQIDPKNQAFVLNQDKETLRNAPGFDKDHWPETNDHSLENAGTYWGGFMGSNTGSEPY